MATTQTKLVGFCLGNKANYNATAYANHIWFDPTNKQIILNGIEYIPKKLSELVNDKNFLTSITKAMVEGVLTGNITSHTHSYLPLSGGTMSNTNLVTNLNADLLDGYHASSFYKHATAYPYGSREKTWHKIATFSQSTNNAQINTSISFYVSEYYNSRSYGIFTVRARAEENSASLSFLTVDFLVNAGISTSDIVATWKNTGNNNIVINVYAFRSGWSSFSFRKIEEQQWGIPQDKWVTLNAQHGNENCYASIPSDENQVISTNIDINNNVASASKWTSARTITLTGSVTGSVSIDGSANVSLVTTTNHTHNEYLPLTGGTLSGALTCNGDYINMNNDSGSRGYRGFFNQSNNTSRASGSHIFMKGGGEALGTNSVSIGYQAYAGIRNKDSDATTYPYIAWQWMTTEKFSVDTTNSATLSGGEYYGFPLLPNEMVQWNIGGQNVIYENSSSYKELLVVIKASDADTGLVFGGKTTLPYRASKALIAGKYIVGTSEYLKNITEFTINDVKYYQVIINTWDTTAFPTIYDFTQQVKVMCATKVNNSNYSGASSYASGDSSVASGSFSVASGVSSVASGAYSVASGVSSVARGSFSVASGAYSVASGAYSVASGESSVASGESSVASGDFSVVLARNGETMSSYQTIVGKFNAKVAGLFIIGNGTSDTARSNAFVVDDSGNVTAKYFSGYANAIGGEGFKIYAENNNQINFGGTASDTTIVFGAASKDNRNVPTTYKFGANGTATIQAASFSGNAATATALTSSAGSATQPIYFSNGKPVACSYTLGKSVPSNAVFTDTTYSVATASADGLMSAAMFKAKMVKSVSVRQGDTAVIEGGSITNHSVYITQKKNNITDAYQQAIGEYDVKIPNATKDYDGSMSYTDKRKLDKMPPTTFGAQLIFYNNEILVDGIYGDYNIESGDATVDGYETIQENNHYITLVAFNIINTDLRNKLNNGYVKFGYSSKDNNNYQTMRLLQSNFDGSVLSVEFIHATPIGNKSFYFDCIWEVYPII